MINRRVSIGDLVRLAALAAVVPNEWRFASRPRFAGDDRRRDEFRTHFSPLCMRLEDYRLRYSQYKSDEHLRAAHAARPWVVTWDDHEVSNNYAGLIAQDTTLTTDMMRARRAAAYRAWWEHQPVRLPASGDWSNLSITRTISWGSLAQFWVMDTRQFRSDQACGDGTKELPCGEWADPSRTMMGARQEKWMLDGISASRACAGTCSRTR